MAISLIAASAASAAYLNAKYNIFPDLRALYGIKYAAARTTERLYQEHGDNDWSLYHLLDKVYQRMGPKGARKEALLFEGRSWSYHDLVEDIGKLEKKLREKGIGCGDIVAMIANNSPEFLIAIFALWKIGAVPGPINTSLTSAPLKHCLGITHTRFVLTTNELLPAINSTLQEYASENSDTQTFCYDYDTYSRLSDVPSNITHIQHNKLDNGDTSFNQRPIRVPEDPCMLLYTSGTTGRPKAVKWPCGMSMMVRMERWPYLQLATDRWYCALPCFHGTAIWACICPTLAMGGTVILARKFSTSMFWKDIVDSKATAVIYIGEMCRYLAQAPKSPHLTDERTSHKVEKMYGLGMSAEVWATLRERFGIPLIAEYWSATEATGLLVNVNQNSFGLGRIGRFSPLMKYFNENILILRRDFTTGGLLRDPRTGLCIQALDNEPGEAVTKVDPTGGILIRHSYLGNEPATLEKAVRGVLTLDDEYTRIGDLLVRDSDGFIKFVDRLGHGWRNKGHNISATEVESVLATHPSIISTSAFPIAMNQHGYEGQLGCCVLTVHPEMTDRAIHGLEEYMLKGGLPVYAIPRFLRIAETDVQGVSAVFKKQKEDYKSEGFEPKSGDRMYWIKNEREGYTRLDQENTRILKSGQARL